MGFGHGDHLGNEAQAVTLLSLISDRALQKSLKSACQNHSSIDQQIKDNLAVIDNKAQIRQMKMQFEDFSYQDHELHRVVKLLENLEISEQDMDEYVTTIRNILRPYWQSEDAQKTVNVALATNLESTVYQTLKILAQIAPVNQEDPFTLDSIEPQHKVFLATGHQYDVNQLAKWVEDDKQNNTVKDAFNIEIDKRDLSDVVDSYHNLSEHNQSANSYRFFGSSQQSPEPRQTHSSRPNMD